LAKSAVTQMRLLLVLQSQNARCCDALPIQ